MVPALHAFLWILGILVGDDVQCMDDPGLARENLSYLFLSFWVYCPIDSRYCLYYSQVIGIMQMLTL
jgi:hypothetical protein